MQKYYVVVDDPSSQTAGTRWYLTPECTIYHRTDGPAIDRVDGHKEWWVNGWRHRTDGPAIIDEVTDGATNTAWYINGKKHRTDGPAVEWADGDVAYWLDGVEVTEQEHARRTQPAQEMTVAQIEKLLGKRIKIVK